MNKPGRPKRTQDDKQASCVSVWLRADEKESIMQVARAARLPVSTWAGKVVVEAAKRALEAIGL